MLTKIGLHCIVNYWMKQFYGKVAEWSKAAHEIMADELYKIILDKFA